MKTVEAVDGDVRFTTAWGAIPRYVFVPVEIIAQDAGQTLSRAEAVEFVREHLEQYAAEARAQQGDEATDKIVILVRS